MKLLNPILQYTRFILTHGTDFSALKILVAGGMHFNYTSSNIQIEYLNEFYNNMLNRKKKVLHKWKRHCQSSRKLILSFDLFNKNKLINDESFSWTPTEATTKNPAEFLFIPHRHYILSNT